MKEFQYSSRDEPLEWTHYINATTQYQLRYFLMPLRFWGCDLVWKPLKSEQIKAFRPKSKVHRVLGRISHVLVHALQANETILVKLLWREIAMVIARGTGYQTWTTGQ